MRRKQEKRLITASLIFIGLFASGAGVGMLTSHADKPSIKKPVSTQQKKTAPISASSSSVQLNTSSQSVSSTQSTTAKSKQAASASSSIPVDPSVTGPQTQSTGATNGSQPNFKQGETSANAETYTVQTGDNIWEIAQTNHYDYQAMLRANPDIDPNLIYRGQMIKVK
jgi:LysM repeat protein